MKRQLQLFSVTFFITLVLAYSFSCWTEGDYSGGSFNGTTRTMQNYPVGRSLQPVYTITLACPRMDMMRLWPLPIQQPWFEDWWEKKGVLSNTNSHPILMEHYAAMAPESGR